MEEIVKQCEGGPVGPTTPEIAQLKIRTKADAIVYAIEMSMFSQDPYKQAQKLFNFICKNVELPDTDVLTLEQVHKVAAEIVDMVYEKARGGGEMKGLRVRIKHLEHIKGFLLYDKDSRKYIFEYDDGRRVDIKYDFNYTIFEYLHSPFFADKWLPLSWDDFINLRK